MLALQKWKAVWLELGIFVILSLAHSFFFFKEKSVSLTAWSQNLFQCVLIPQGQLIFIWNSKSRISIICLSGWNVYCIMWAWEVSGGLLQFYVFGVSVPVSNASGLLHTHEAVWKEQVLQACGHPGVLVRGKQASSFAVLPLSILYAQQLSAEWTIPV